eukprot:TRINITY_DN6029_c0_g1_i1.p1 TRINITY_DN6029_c0_g1~~TRINITY_DN6029_c0_g1_i1.p1  ORF type:complete len:580 (-),score=140.04 TRINITY_DN6029_c0_g1_i1:43-1782(-)
MADKLMSKLGLVNFNIEECINKDTMNVPKDRLFIMFLRKGVPTKSLREVIVKYLESREFDVASDTKSVAVIEATHRKFKKRCTLSVGLNEKNERMLHFQFTDSDIKSEFLKDLAHELGEHFAVKALLRSQALVPLPNITVIPSAPGIPRNQDLKSSAPMASSPSISRSEGDSNSKSNFHRSEDEEKHEEWTYGQRSMTTFHEKYERVPKTHQDYLLAECLLVSIVKSANEWYLPQLEYKNGAAAIEVEGNMDTKPLQTFKLSHGHNFGFKVHAPIAFAKLRSQFGVSEELYANSFSPETGLFVKKKETNPSKLSTTFFYTSNKNFIVRTITAKEAKFFRSTIDDYYKHMLSNPKTLMCVVCGFYIINTSAVGEEIYVIVMRNFFPAEKPLCHLFDLQGSTVGKTVDESERGDEISLKDLDFVHYYNGIRVSSDERNAIIKALEKDCEFLSSHKMVDYSLLLGVHSPNDTSAGAAASNSTATSQNASGQQEEIVPFYGIVGLFTKYSLNKKLEDKFKHYLNPTNSLKLNDGESLNTKLNALDPVQYKDRLLHFASTIVFSDEASATSYNLKAKEHGWVLL